MSVGNIAAQGFSTSSVRGALGGEVLGLALSIIDQGLRPASIEFWRGMMRGSTSTIILKRSAIGGGSRSCLRHAARRSADLTRMWRRSTPNRGSGFQRWQYRFPYRSHSAQSTGRGRLQHARRRLRQARQIFERDRGLQPNNRARSHFSGAYTNRALRLPPDQKGRSGDAGLQSGDLRQSK